ncbi:glycoprotein hormone alpha-2 [Nerophis lumbriciformis]|uniref:glycoprotein hormone alpha-2 n=1 Tax=Nerophis lumbriciformis TaxID=546530 RepID=UPI003BA9CE1A
MWQSLYFLALPVMSLLLIFSPAGRSSEDLTLTPGCHLYRKYRKHLLGLVTSMYLMKCPPPAFNVTIRSDRRGTCRGTHLAHACVGYCESSAFPSRYSVLVASNFTHNVTSTSQCCTISREAKVKVRLECPGGRHHDELEILTAKACRCDMCRSSRH